MSSKTDIIKIAYKILFNLQIELEGYGDIMSTAMRLVPDSETIDSIGRYKILSKRRNGAYVLLIKTVADGVDKGKPEIMLKNNEVFRFQIKVERSFLDATHLASYDFNNSVLYASNAANHVVATDILVTLPLAIYNASGTYGEGYLVQSGSKYYKALQASDSGNVHGVTETGYWKEITKSYFISQADLKLRTSFSKPVDLDTHIVVEILHNATLSADYKLLDGTLKCREVIYKIRLHT